MLNNLLVVPMRFKQSVWMITTKLESKQTWKFLSLNIVSCPCLRLNNAPVRGYEEDVGNKTTMRFFYPESASYNPGLNNEPGTLMVLVPFKPQDLRWLKEILYNEKRVQAMCENALYLTQTHTRFPSYFASLSYSASRRHINTLLLASFPAPASQPHHEANT